MSEIFSVNELAAFRQLPKCKALNVQTTESDKLSLSETKRSMRKMYKRILGVYNENLLFTCSKISDTDISHSLQLEVAAHWRASSIHFETNMKK